MIGGNAMRLWAATTIVGGMLVLSGCSAGEVAPDAAPGEDDAAMRATTLSILCATRSYQQEFLDFSRQEVTAETLTRLQSMSAEGADLFRRSASAFREPATPWSDDVRPDVETVASYYDAGATLFQHLGDARDSASLVTVLEDLQGMPDPTDAIGRLSAAAGISADLAGECASR